MKQISPHDRPRSNESRRIEPEQTLVRASSRNGAVALVDMTVPELAAAFRGLDQVQEHHERLSGICAIMKGLVLVEAKTKVGHGGFMAWVKENFPKSHKTAGQYRRLAEEFGKLNPKVQFENLRSDMLATIERLDGFQLDLKNPLVKQVADWVDGRSAYQLLLELGPCGRGGDTSSHRRKLTPAQQHEAWLEDCRTDFESALMAIDRVHDKQLWKAPSITNAQRETAADLLLDMARQLRAWNKFSSAQQLNYSAAIDPQALEDEP